jgi:cytoskeletal protein RodZ
MPTATPSTGGGGVSIGATLAAARRHAGLSVAEVSERTRVRENIIAGIEQDDYGPCGGDFYARGHIRAIAGAVGLDPAPLIEEFDERWRTAHEMTAAEAFQPVLPIRSRERRRVRWTAALAVVVLAVLGFAIYKFASGVGKTEHPAAAASHHPARSQPAVVPSITPSVQGSPVVAPSASPTITPSASPVALQALAPASVAAFGPAGTADGDHPQQASLAIAGHPASPWTSDWYATAGFGDLKAGTGLLLDMGRTVTISSVRLSLAAFRGADLELRVGSTPVLARLRTVATSAGAGGTVQLSLSSAAHARYLLIWFTKLPSDGAGTYRASIYAITVRGHR